MGKLDFLKMIRNSKVYKSSKMILGSVFFLTYWGIKNRKRKTGCYVKREMNNF